MERKFFSTKIILLSFTEGKNQTALLKMWTQTEINERENKKRDTA